MTASMLDGEPLETSKAAHIAALLFVMLLPTASTVLYFIILSGSPLMKLVYGGCKVVQFAFPLVWMILIQRRKPRPAHPDTRSIVWGLSFGAAAVAAGLAAYFGYFKSSPFLRQAPELIAAKIQDMGLTTPAVYAMFAIFLAVPHSFLEEYYWRWFAFGQLRRIIPSTAANVISSLAFMSHHVIVIHQFLQGPWFVTLFFSLCVAFGGGVWAWLYQRFGSLYGAWFSHLLVDLGIMFIGFDLIRWD